MTPYLTLSYLMEGGKHARAARQAAVDTDRGTDEVGSDREKLGLRAAERGKKALKQLKKRGTRARTFKRITKHAEKKYDKAASHAPDGDFDYSPYPNPPPKR